MHEEMNLERHGSRKEHLDSRKRRRGARVSKREQRENWHRRGPGESMTETCVSGAEPQQQCMSQLKVPYWY